MDLGQVLGGLAVAAVTGLAFLAVRFPEPLRTVCAGGTVIIGVLIVAGLAYDTGISIGANAVLPNVSIAQTASAVAAAEARRVPEWIKWSVTGLNLYFMFLCWLSGRLAAEQKKKDSENEQAK